MDRVNACDVELNALAAAISKVGRRARKAAARVESFLRHEQAAAAAAAVTPEEAAALAELQAKRKREKKRLANQNQQQSKSHRQALLAAGQQAVTVNGLRYALPTVQERVTYFKDKFVGSTVLESVAQMWRLQAGTQPLEESKAHWLGEINAGRVKLSRHRARRDDPIKEWAVVTEEDRVLHRGDKVMITSCTHERVVPAT
eukprot:gene32191-2986_t